MTETANIRGTSRIPRDHYRAFLIAMFAATCAFSLIGCASRPAMSQVRIVEPDDGDPNHPDYAHPREVIVTGREANQLATLFPELGAPPQQPGGVAGGVRFGVFFERADGTTRSVYVLNAMDRWWIQASNWPLSPEARERLETLIKRASKNPVTEAHVIQSRDELGHLFASPRCYITAVDAAKVASLIPSPPDRLQLSESADFSPQAIQVRLMHANGNQECFIVDKGIFAELTPAGVSSPMAFPPPNETALRKLAAQAGAASAALPASTAPSLSDSLRARRALREDQK